MNFSRLNNLSLHLQVTQIWELENLSLMVLKSPFSVSDERKFSLRSDDTRLQDYIVDKRHFLDIHSQVLSSTVSSISST